MTKSVELVPLNCPRCGTGAKPLPVQVLWICRDCGEGAYLDEKDELNPININYVAALPTRGRLVWKPYWNMAGRVSITGRETYDRNEGPSALWSQQQTFWVAAFEAPIANVIQECRKLLDEPPILAHGPRVEFEPATIDIPTAKVLTQFVVLSIEAESRDSLTRIDLQMQFDPPSLWVLPWESRGGNALQPRFKVTREGPGLLETLQDQARQLLKLLKRGD